MEDKDLKQYLRESLRQETQPARLEETIQWCIGIMGEQKSWEEEPRTGFFEYLSDVFRLEGLSILGLQAAALFTVCLFIFTMADTPKSIPIFMPLFVLASMSAIFKSQYYGMGEMEAATRASGAQITLARLILAGGANLVCITVLLCLSVSRQHSGEALGQMALYCLVPYLVCMAVMLRMLRLCKKERIPACAAVMLGSCGGWGMSARMMPWIYETSAMGLWGAAFLVFAVFFIKEICFIAEMRREGKMYGIIV